MVLMAEPRTVLFLFADTGAGHRRAAEAVMAALASNYPGCYRVVLCDPLTGPAAPRPLRLLAGLYGPAVRLAPWSWGAAYHLSNSRAAMAVLSRTAFAGAAGVVAAEHARTRADVIVSCHPLTGRAAVRAARSGGTGGRVPVVTVVTDLAATHASWRYPRADVLTVPSARAAAECLAGGIPAARCLLPGLPVAAAAEGAPLAGAERAAIRRSLGLAETEFVVLLAGGGEGCGGLARRTTAILRRHRELRVVTACGRNERVRRRLAVRAARAGGRLTVLGFVGNFTDWLRCADLVVTKAGPGVIAEAACSGTPMLLTSHLPGQERGNTELVLAAGAGRRARGIRGMLRELAMLRADPRLLAALRSGSQNLARPGAAAEIAGLIAGLAPPLPSAAAPAGRLAGPALGARGVAR
jgi:1,2-diacylglycerol 3-beta-galactosyltransferase